MMEVNIHEAKTQLSRLLQRVAAGEEVTIANRGIPVARLISVAQPSSRRVLGIESGRLKIAKAFDAPLPDNLLGGYLGETKKEATKRRK
jgi:prevent-host-death family protein